MLRRACLLIVTGLVASGHAPSARAAPFESYATGDDRSALFARWNAAHGDAYALDEVKRFIEWTGPAKPRIECDRAAMVAYSGSTLRYAGALMVDPAFRERLARFEAVVAEVGTELYGRAPRTIRHYGAYSCRTSRKRAYRVSEHALGNAIDVVGFDFGAAGKSVPLPEDVPRSLRFPFQIRIARHWGGGKTAASQLHERFLHELTSRLEGRPDIFRILIGPGHGNHDDHFHFDASPWRYIDL